MLKRRVILMMIFCIFLVTSISFASMLLYFDPYQNKILSLSLIGVSFVSMVTCIFSLVLYFFKKIYYRGEVGIFHILTSLRQAGFISSIFIGAILIQMLGIPLLLPIILLISSVLLLELFIQSF